MTAATRRQRRPAAAAPARRSVRSGRARAGSSSGCSALVALALVVGSVSLGATVDGQVRPVRRRRAWSIYLGGAVRRPRRAGPRRPADGPDPAADRRDARRDLAAADAAAAAGPRDPDVLRDRRSASPRSSSSGCSSRWPSRRRSAIVVRSDSWLRRYKYTWAAVGVGLLLLTFVLRHGDQRPAPDPPARAVQRPADRAAEGHPRRLPGRLPVGEPGAARRAGHAASGRCACRRCRTSRRWSRCGRSPSASSSSSATSARRCCSSASSSRCSTSRPARISLVIIGLVLFLLGSALMADAVRPHPDPGRHLARPVRRPARRRLPGRPGAARVRPRRAARGRPRRRPARDRRPAADPRGPHGLPAGGARRGARDRSASSRSSGCTSSSSSAACGSARPRPTTSGRCSRSGSRWSSASRRSSSRPATSRSCR